MQGNVILGALLPIVFCTSVLVLILLWMRRKGIAAQHEKARNAFAAALATKNIKIDPTDVTTKQGAGGVILCEVTYALGLYANGEYRPSGRVLVRFYCRSSDNDSNESFWYPPIST